MMIYDDNDDDIEVIKGIRSVHIPHKVPERVLQGCNASPLRRQTYEHFPSRRV